MNLKQITGPWDDGYVLDKHSLKSEYAGDNEWGHPQFTTVRTDAGEATFLLKNRNDFTQALPLAQAIATHIYPLFTAVELVVPMPASTARPRQPVAAVAGALGQLVGKPVFTGLLRKTQVGPSMKDMKSKAQKLAAIGDSLWIRDVLPEGRWNVLLVDDLFHTGASMEKACTVLRACPKVRGIYVAAFTWRSA
ncbi:MULTISPECIES: ComF family protein [unclassified Variovorax]|uniref:ComF family protein n=1 Tax=unclassified Variovorax TaxID=663243 RepID=UPI003F4812BB